MKRTKSKVLPTTINSLHFSGDISFSFWYNIAKRPTIPRPVTLIARKDLET